MAKKTASESILREKSVRTSKVKIEKDQRFKSLKSISIISVLLVIGICIVLNLILDLTLDRTLTFDTTSVKTNSISHFSELYIDSLDKKVEIIGLFDRNDTSYEWLDYFIPIMDDYEAKGDGKIELKYVDPAVDPFILSELDPDGLYGLSSGMYVIRSGERLLPLYPYQCFAYDNSLYLEYGISMPITNYIELNVTGSISYVASSRPRKAYVLSGHGDQSYNAMDSILKTYGFVTSSVSLKGESSVVPSDCEILLILEPQSDLTLTEKEAVLTYLDNHGKILVVNDYNGNERVDYSNLNEVTKRMGVSMEDGVIRENDVSARKDVDDPFHSIGFASSYCLQALSVPAYYDAEFCRYMKVYLDNSNSIEVAPLIETSSDASVEFQNAQIDSSVSSGTYPIVMVSYDTSVETDPPYMIIVATDTFTSDSYFTSLNDNGNATFIRALLGDVLQIDWNMSEQATLVPEKTIPSYTLSKPLSSSAATWWSLCVMTIIPLGSLICGIYIYHKRRHL